jgi:valyl-tRNA synthetase
VLDPDRKKMSKSKGNVVTPLEHLDAHGSDAVRYWAASARTGTDTTFDVNQIKVGRRLATKLLNASKFALGMPSASAGEVTEPIDKALLTLLAGVVEEATAAYAAYEPSRALERTEAFFWTFCDDYIELVKARAYGEGAAADSARRTLRIALSTLLRLFAPVLAFASEEVWSWWQPGSVHRAQWPTTEGLKLGGDPAVLAVAGEALAQIRKAKSTAKVTMKTPVTSLVVTDSAARLALLRLAEVDVVNAGLVQGLSYVEGDLAVEVTLGEPPVKAP